MTGTIASYRANIALSAWASERIGWTRDRHASPNSTPKRVASLQPELDVALQRFRNTIAMRIAAPWIAGTSWLGGWNYFLNMVRICRRFAPDIEFILICAGELEEKNRLELSHAGAQLLPVQTPASRSYAGQLLGLRDRIVENVLTEANADAVFELISFRRRYGVPALVWIPDFQHRKLPEFFPFKERIKRDLNFRARLQSNHHAMVSSRSALHDLLEFIPQPRAQVDVVPFAVAPVLQITPDVIEETRDRHRLSSPYFFMPNQLWQHKNHATAFRAVALAARQAPDILLVLSGEAADSRAKGYAADLLRLISEMRIENNVRFLNTIPHADLIALLAGARALLNPSLFEGWSTTVEEAKALGTPLILSALDVHREQVSENAVFFDPHDGEALADALMHRWTAPEDNYAARRAKAEQRSLVAQKAYAEKLHAVLVATIADGV